MVVGNGMIANIFKSYQTSDSIVIFASGVSDSTHSPTDAFEREKKLLTKTINEQSDKLLVYFSTCSIYDHSMAHSAYVKHKKEMEELIIAQQPHYLVFRLSNPVGKTSNTHTVVNYFIKNILEKRPFEVWKYASRNIIDIDDMYMVCNEILLHHLFSNTIINIANPHNYPVSYIVETIEQHFKTDGNYTLTAKGDGPHIDITQVEPLFRKFNINFDQDYLSKLFQKYFPLS